METNLSSNPSPSMEVKLISIKELLKQSLAMYKMYFKKLIAMSLIPVLAYIPVAIVAGLFYLQIEFGPSWGSVAAIVIYIILSLLALAALLVAMYVYFLAQIGSYILVKDWDKNLPVWPTFKAAKPLLVDFFQTNILTSVILILWFLLLIVPGIMMSVYYSFVAWVFIMEGLKNKAAMRRSKELVQGRWWLVFARIFLPTFIISMIFGVPSAFIEPDTQAEQIYSNITDVLSFIIAPFFLIYTYNLYKNLVGTKK